MLAISELQGFTVGASDGEIGSVHDVYFDARSWTVRYVVVDTGSWLIGRRVLLSPWALEGTDRAARRLDVTLTRQQVEDSPPVDTALPVSRQYEIDLSRHYGYPPYWAGSLRWGLWPYPAVPPAYPAAGPGGATPLPNAVEEEILARARQDREESDLHSAREVTGYDLHASDGDLGHVEDFLVDDRTWAIRYMVVDTRNWLPGKHVLVSPEWIEDVDWRESRVRVRLARATVERAPEYDPSRPPDRDYEDRLFRHYERPAYWETERRPAA